MPVVSHVAAGFGEFGEFGETFSKARKYSMSWRFVLILGCISYHHICSFKNTSISMVHEVQNVHCWLTNNRKISVPDDWLEACIEWIHAESEVRLVRTIQWVTLSFVETKV